MGRAPAIEDCEEHRVGRHGLAGDLLAEGLGRVERPVREVQPQVVVFTPPGDLEQGVGVRGRVERREAGIPALEPHARRVTGS